MRKQSRRDTSKSFKRRWSSSYLAITSYARQGMNGLAYKIDRGDVTLQIPQLSDGERGMLALVLDLAKRLSQANPSLADPLSESQAVVLIDELDLHLHPKWQRHVARKLMATFPGCQFIATSPLSSSRGVGGS